MSAKPFRQLDTLSNNKIKTIFNDEKRAKLGECVAAKLSEGVGY